MWSKEGAKRWKRWSKGEGAKRKGKKGGAREEGQMRDKGKGAKGRAKWGNVKEKG